ncbi:aminodeoxychorismate/anthranilate synthase component II [Candidatus Bathyarchaeota archaeon]|nr:aminodeoxychorismate/anthranilate synthase component II [Candidatus Bathyarchaeota archaeon]MDP6048272.1 aminodeoxychorismate/anthranilate synthase component II [Candidatus Bathyarchaeota archaeon]MDP6457897.1 aminodeoxychorismate/anthranilate synthase component II [Candidatus Bathyarchaeota archaeon]MDP7207632.1 aminodeoxychorismate/anthranilate synthase component II [Candidatus Bathyarchaeota archaeon]MDP7443176.1 aminodeoxychorismate/anthranilate synthase component II [Candidatus Bathyarc
MKVLVIDNYDSFVYNLVQYVGELGGAPVVYRNDQITLEEAIQMNPDKIVISPGPGDPQDPKYFGVCSGILRRMSPTVPTLGVCLGHQGIIATYGGKVIRARKVVHGKPSIITHDGKGLFKGIENPLEATRYHSLVGEKGSIPDCLEVTAVSLDDSEIMGVRHVEFPIEGVQFHPESILTTSGKRIITNFLEM